MSVPSLAASATPFLANIPSPAQGVWYIGPVPLRAYALCLVAGIVVAIIWAERRWRARGGRAGT
ncbi:MAG: prolipoprotein diacylglyceryl transferase, partial [Saccharopolyspora sp.]|nr:prolipoprotein diacylglyceryl transferase [Saccharopolyspora sp.]